MGVRFLGVVALAGLLGIGAEAKTKQEEFDLSGLPAYQPHSKVVGTIRVWGNDTMDVLMEEWGKKFVEHHPGIRFENNLATTAVAIPALSVGVADIGAMDREVWPIELISYLKMRKGVPLQVSVAGGTFNVANKTWAITVFVHKDNPLDKLTMEQLDGIFGAERIGRWDETKSRWIPDTSRGRDKNVRTWGQLGLTGEWKDKEIQTYGFDLTSSGFSFFFADRVFNGATKWNENLREFAGQQRPDGTFVPSPPQVTEALGQDRYGIGFSGTQYAGPNLKALAIAPVGSKEYIFPTRQTSQDMSYPLARSLYFLVEQTKEGTIDPKVREFMRFVLSREGQRIVAAEGDYLPLPHHVVQAQLEKLR